MNLLLGRTFFVTSQTTGSKYVICGELDVELAGTTVNDVPANEPLVVTARVTVAPGGTPGPVRIQAPDVCAGSPFVESDPGFPEALMLFTLTPDAPRANPPCSGALEGRLITSVYVVPLPVAEHVSPLG